MLRIVQNSSPDGAKRYFSQSDYYIEGQEQELAGRWGGKGAELLGLEGEVTKEAFDALCENKHPTTGKRLTPRTKADRTVGYDFNFNVPKGVSIVATLNADKRIIEAISESECETMREIETEMKTRLRGQGRNEDRVTGNLVYAEFVHLTGRPVDGIPDPNCHVHAFTFNVTHTGERWQAGQFRDLKRDAPYYQAVFDARLGRRLEALHYPIERRGNNWDLAGIPRSLAAKFSRRTAQIEKLAKEKGIRDPDRKAELGAKSREKKQKNLSMSALREIWRERLTNTQRKALSELGERKEATVHNGSMQQAEAEAMDHAVRHCFERNSVVPKKEVLAEALKFGLGRVDVEGLKNSLAAEDVIVRSLDGREMATTKSVLAEERAMLSFARAGRGSVSPLNPTWRIKRDWLNAGQRAAVHHVLETRDRVAMVKGDAGTGKTSLMQEAADAIRDGGHEVFVFAPSAEASRNTLRGQGFDTATTVAELLVNEKLQAQARGGQVLWIDEAGLLGSRTLKQVFDLAERLDARVILSGDWKQHSAVERGGAAMRLLEQEAGIKPAVVTEIQRQRGSYREAVGLIAAGRMMEGFDQFDRLGWIKEVPEAEQRNRQVARDYADSLANGEDAIVICPTHAEGDRITAAIRDELRSRKMLGKEDRQFNRLTSRNLTEAERSDPAMFVPGNVIVFTQNAPGHKKGERITVGESVSTDLTKLAARFQVYRADQVPLAVGDVVRITVNGTSQDGHRLNNGAVYKVAGFTKAGSVRLDNGWLVGAGYGFLTLGHVGTSHSSQGRTCEHHVIVAQSSESLPATSREQFYVSASRSRRKLTVYLDEKSAVREAIQNSDSRMAATELVSKKEKRLSLVNRAVRYARMIAQWRPNREVSKQGELTYGR